jgi:hypothetical protein
MEGEAVDAIVIVSILLCAPARVTCTLTAVLGAVSQGTWKLICVGLT